MITSITVKRTGKLVSWMPWFMVDCIPDGQIVVSIAMTERERPKFKPGQIVIRVEDDGMLSIDDVQHVFDQIDRIKQDHQVINVHCHQGRVRSKWLAERIHERFPEYQLVNEAPGGFIYIEGDLDA